MSIFSRKKTHDLQGNFDLTYDGCILAIDNTILQFYISIFPKHPMNIFFQKAIL